MEPGEIHVELSTLLDREQGLEESAQGKRQSLDSDSAESQAFGDSKGDVYDCRFLKQSFRPVESHEDKSRWDLYFKWQAAEEKKVVRKIDLRIFFWICLMFFALQVDRSNIDLAPSDDELKDLQLTTKEYNVGQTIHFATFILAELPSVLICKRIGPDRWLPIQMIAWSLVASLQSGLSGRDSFWITRALIGLCEGGFGPSIILYLSYWYTSSELPIRLSFLWAGYQAASVFIAFTSWILLHMSGLYATPGWHWLFGLESALTFALGFMSYLYLPPSPTETASKFRGEDGWFTLHEEKIMVNRILRDDPSKGDMHNREAITSRMFWNSLTDYHLWPTYLLGLTWGLSILPAAKQNTLNLRRIGYSPLMIQLLTAPTHVLWTINLLISTGLSEWLNERILLSSFSQIWVLPMLVALVRLPEDRERMHTYAVLFMLSAQPFVHAILAGLASRNSGSVRTRAVSAALYNMCFRASHIVGLNLYRSDDAPFYFDGNQMLFGLAVLSFFLFLATKLFYVVVNRTREAKWSSMSHKAKEEYLVTTKDEGNKRLDFRFAH